ncbi:MULTISPECIES: hypothetical protein [Pandoraea]|uniref:hypothetical protein n=1 Tax=Pandoraea TaxID=93217 RepID=UPI001F5C1493|nr:MULTISPECIES: hypothetical protein [Pandoraea]MCI3206554.1 hypothetical protein [Pandoraea sp. LA3]MDN4584582.1 hypothetical protein [Pandoraea capi]
MKGKKFALPQAKTAVSTAAKGNQSSSAPKVPSMKSSGGSGKSLSVKGLSNSNAGNSGSRKLGNH